MSDDKNNQIKEVTDSKLSAQRIVRKGGCAIVILLIFIFPFILLGGSQLFDSLSVSNRNESKLAIEYVQNKYSEEFKIIPDTVHYNQPAQIVRLKAFSETEPNIIFSVEVLLEEKNRKYRDDYLIQKGFNLIFSQFFKNEDFFYEVSPSYEEDFENLTYSEEQKKHIDNWEEYLKLFENKHFNISLYTYWTSNQNVNDVKIDELNAFIEILKAYSLSVGRVNLRYDIENIKGDKEKFDLLVEYLKKSIQEIKTIKVEYESCQIPIDRINTKNELLIYIKENCTKVKDIISES